MNEVATLPRTEAEAPPPTHKIPRYAVIPTRGNRMPSLIKTLSRMEEGGVQTIVLDNSDDGWEAAIQAVALFDGQLWSVHQHREQPVNLSRLWNLGLELVAGRAARQGAWSWDVAIINDDAIPSPDWFRVCSEAMRSHGVAAACVDPTGTLTQDVVHRQPGPVGLWTRMTGYAFLLAGEAGVRADERLRWYFTDDHIDWKSREAGGMVMTHGASVQHLYPNGQVTDELQAIIAEDARIFEQMWRMRPW